MLFSNHFQINIQFTDNKIIIIFIEYFISTNKLYNHQKINYIDIKSFNMAQGKLKTKVKLPSNVKTKSVHRLDISKKKQPNRPKKSKKKNLLQKEVEKEIRKNIEADVRAKAT